MKALALVLLFAMTPDELRSLLDRAEKVELLALDPYSDRENFPKDAVGDFHGFAVMKKVALEGKQKRAAIEAIDRATLRDSEFVTACFHPRHGLRGTVDGKPIELLICFECATMFVTRGGKEQRMNVDGNGQPPLDELLGIEQER